MVALKTSACTELWGGPTNAIGSSGNELSIWLQRVTDESTPHTCLTCLRLRQRSQVFCGLTTIGRVWCATSKPTTFFAQPGSLRIPGVSSKEASASSALPLHRAAKPSSVLVASMLTVTLRWVWRNSL